VSIPSRCRAMVFDGPGMPLRLVEIPVAWPKAGEAIVQVELTTLGSDDFGVITGKDAAPAPLILGHETVGTILALGDPPPLEFNGTPLEVGDRIIWSRYVSCGDCFYCRRRLPQECESLREYGRTALGDPPRLSGSLAELGHLWPKTAIFKVPKSLSRQIAAAIPHAGAQVCAAVDALISPINSAVILGDSLEAKIAFAILGKRGSTTVALESPEQVLKWSQIRQTRDETRGVDAVIDFSGEENVLSFAIRSTRIGGAISLATASIAPLILAIDLRELVKKNLRLTGIHRYKPEHLASALDFVINANAEGKLPFQKLIPAPRPFSEVNEAIAGVAKDHSVRIAFEPDQD
jgi:threonine dehydrogenase-like Zn-dependent dehydrogenase